MNALTKIENTALSAMNEAELIKVLQSSLYPGAALESIKMVLGYCKASGLDPMQKPVHIVPMWDGKAKQMRDVVMPGVNLYRTQAARSGECAGVSEPEFGPDVSDKIGGQQITYPAWCRVTIKRRLPTGEIVDFTAREFWLENYAIKGGQEKSVAPNAMWTKRPYGQIAKCAEAQALRRAFPEIAGMTTADEVEGKPLRPEDSAVQIVEEVVTPAAPSFYPQDQFDKNLPAWHKVVEAGRKTPDQIISMAQTKFPLTDDQKGVIRALRVEVEVVREAAPKVTYAKVAEAITKAQDSDVLADAGTLIGEVADADQRGELTALFNKREEELQGA